MRTSVSRFFNMYESVTLSLTDDKTSLNSTYFPPINVYENSEIALLSLQTYNTFPNINTSNNQLVIIIENGFNTYNKSIELETGCYEFSDIKKCILDKIKKINLELNVDVLLNLSVDSKNLKCYVYCNYTVDFNIQNSIASVLGFEKITLTPNIFHESSKIFNINSVNTIKVMCNIANGSFHNGKSSHAVYEFSPDVNIGRKIIEKPNNLIYYPLTTNIINSINITLLDQDYMPIYNLGEKVSIILHIKRCDS